MAEFKFTKATDQEHEIKLDSYLVYAEWKSGYAYIGRSASFVIGTSLVGNGAKIEITGKTESGKKLGKIKDTIDYNIYSGSFDIPDDLEPGDEISFEVKLSKNGLSGESGKIALIKPPELVSLEWSASEARRGDILTLTGEFRDIPDDSEVKVTIYESDQDGAHDRITEMEAVLKGKKLASKWEYEYHEDTDEIPTDEEMERYGGSYNPPEYFFTVSYHDLEMGKEKESGLLTFKDYIEIKLRDAGGNPKADAAYVLHLPDGSTKDGNLDSQGQAREDGIPPGNIRVEFPDLRQVDPAGQAETQQE
ncbi:MAG: hypothetical protein JW746_01400 [Candidatus Krumholzibacteriota bacterium]|nr:hypothetical protein [Candidatus Krumholzibacteriota bacterium]